MVFTLALPPPRRAEAEAMLASRRRSEMGFAPFLRAAAVGMSDLTQGWRCLTEALAAQENDLAPHPFATLAVRILHERYESDEQALRRVLTVLPALLDRHRTWRQPSAAQGELLRAPAACEIAPGHVVAAGQPDLAAQAMLLRAERELLALARLCRASQEEEVLRGWIRQTAAGLLKLKAQATGEAALSRHMPTALWPLFARAATLEEARAALALCRTSPRPAEPLSCWLMADCFAAYGARAEAMALRESLRAHLEEHGFDREEANGVAPCVWLLWCGREEVIDLITPA